MNNRPTDSYTKQNDNNIDLVSFERRKRAAEIIQNEETQRKIRQQQQQKRRRLEMIRRAKRARIKGYCIMGITALGALCIVIGLITFAVKMLSGGSDDNNDSTAVNAVSAEETALMNSFSTFSSYVYTNDDNAFLKTADKMLAGIAVDGSAAGIPAVSKNISEYGALSERYMFYRDSENYAEFRNAVKNAPIFSNGYVWSETDSMKSTVTGGYLYDTNASYILAVANICLAEGSTAFLSETDSDAQPTKDVSRGLTVSKKLEMAINYLFDSNTIDGGIKYDALYTSLCYIHTKENAGNSTGTPSNRWTNFKLGYLDAYCNITFNKAMRALVDLYNLQGLTDDAGKYKAVADQNSAAFSEKFWDGEKQRFVGCFDANGVPSDYGFVFVNLEAIYAGMATDYQASQIFAWLDGSRVIDTDTSKGTDIYSFGFAPRNTTIAADDKLWDTHSGKVIISGNGGFGMYYQNGGASLQTAYYDIMSRYNNGMYDSVKGRINALAGEYNSSGFISDGSGLLEMSGNPLSGLAPVAVAKVIFGLETDGLHLTVNPQTELIPGNLPNAPYEAKLLGIKGISFLNNVYNFLYSDGDLYVTSGLKSAVRLKLGGFEPGGNYQLVRVANGEFSVDETVLVADSQGIISVTAEFGSDSYIKIEKATDK